MIVDGQSIEYNAHWTNIEFKFHINRVDVLNCLLNSLCYLLSIEWIIWKMHLFEWNSTMDKMHEWNFIWMALSWNYSCRQHQHNDMSHSCTAFIWPHWVKLGDFVVLHHTEHQRIPLKMKIAPERRSAQSATCYFLLKCACGVVRKLNEFLLHDTFVTHSFHGSGIIHTFSTAHSAFV